VEVGEISEVKSKTDLLEIEREMVGYCCGASEPEASERSSSLIYAERGF
jgi:hypothetical protein